MASFEEYMAKVCNWQKGYSLPKAILPLFSALFQKRHGGGPNLLTRMMRDRLGKNHKVAFDVFIELMEFESKGRSLKMASHMELVQDCREILNATHEALVSIDYFPFFKLPLELRRRVYEQHINDLLPESWSGAMRPCTRPSCGCLRVVKANTEQPEVLQLTLARTSRAVKDEFLATWFESQYFSFRCGCELRHHLAKNKVLSNNIRSLKLEWSGRGSDKAFSRLRRDSKLQYIEICITNSTTAVKSKREREWNEHFIPRLHSRLTDACGFDELVELVQHIGLDKVKISHNLDKVCDRRARVNVYYFESYLKSKCKTTK